jgi:hypothetical protein
LVVSTKALLYRACRLAGSETSYRKAMATPDPQWRRDEPVVWVVG